MNEEEKNTVEELEKQLRLLMNIDDITTTIRNDEAQTILNLIEKLQKENEELREIYKSEKKMKNEYVKLYQDLLLKENVIPVQKVKDNLIKYQEEYELLLEHQSGKESNRTKYLRGRIHMCQELLESEE